MGLKKPLSTAARRRPQAGVTCRNLCRNQLSAALSRRSLAARRLVLGHSVCSRGAWPGETEKLQGGHEIEVGPRRLSSSTTAASLPREATSRPSTPGRGEMEPTLAELACALAGLAWGAQVLSLGTSGPYAATRLGVRFARQGLAILGTGQLSQGTRSLQHVLDHERHDSDEDRIGLESAQLDLH